MNNDLISKEALIKAVEDLYEYAELDEVLEVIKNAPTIDNVINVYPKGEVIVQEERPHGKWGEVFHYQGWNYHKCSNCHFSLKLSDYENFCPNCGAKMEAGDRWKEEEDEE